MMIADYQNDYRYVCLPFSAISQRQPSHARAIADATIRRVTAVRFVESAVVIDASIRTE